MQFIKRIKDFKKEKIIQKNHKTIYVKIRIHLPKKYEIYDFQNKLNFIFEKTIIY
jgi:hypothetical protein